MSSAKDQKPEDELRAFARKRLKSQQELRQFLGIWGFVSVLTSGIWFLTSPGGYFWPIWAIGGMGIAAFFMWFEGYGPGLKRAITESDVDAELERLKRKG